MNIFWARFAFFKWRQGRNLERARSDYNVLSFLTQGHYTLHTHTCKQVEHTDDHDGRDLPLDEADPEDEQARHEDDQADQRARNAQVLHPCKTKPTSTDASINTLRSLLTYLPGVYRSMALQVELLLLHLFEALGRGEVVGVRVLDPKAGKFVI